MRLKVAGTFLACLVLVFCATSQKKIERLREKDSGYQYNLGLFYLNNGQPDEALKYLKKSLSLDPRYYLAWNALGQAHWMKGQLEDSIKDFQKCLEINPTLTEVHNNLGVTYQELGLLDKAELEFRLVIADTSYKSRELGYYNLARLCLLKEKIPEALTHIEKALEINRSFVMGYNLKGILKERLNDFEAAVESYKQGLRYAADDINLNFNLAVAYFKQNELKKAEEILVKIYPNVTDPEMKEKIDQYLKTIRKLPSAQAATTSLLSIQLDISSARP